MRGAFGMTEDGRYALKFERDLPHPREKVWRALTERAQLRAWFVSILDYDKLQFAPELGAKLVFVPNSGTEVGYGEVTACEPPDLLEYTWDGEILRWELKAVGSSNCHLVFTTIFDDKDFGEPLSEGWNTGLDQLEAFLTETG